MSKGVHHTRPTDVSCDNSFSRLPPTQNIRILAENVQSEATDNNASDTSHSDGESTLADQDETSDPIIAGAGVVQDEEKTPASSREVEPSRPKDPYRVTWDGSDDPANPKNWPTKRKWAATIVVASFTFISPLASSMVAPALSLIAQDLNITSNVERAIVLSVFVLAYAVGVLFAGPLSEIYGRVTVIQLANLIFLIFNLGCGFAQTKTQLIVLRFFSGLGGSAPVVLGGGVIGDCFPAEQRGRALSLYALMPLLGPAVGPIAGGFIAMKTTWRWIFWAVTIADCCIQGIGLVLLRETFAPKLLGLKAKRIRKETGDDKYLSEYETADRTFLKILRVNLVRPFRLLFTQPIIQVITVYMAYIYGLMYLVLSTFPTVWEDVYHESIGVGGLNYISLGAGFLTGALIAAPLNDRIYRRLKRRNNNVAQPEFRLPLMVPGSILVPAGLFLYGWSAEYKTHWIVPDIGAYLFGTGTVLGFSAMQTFVIEAYTLYAASALAATSCLRSFAAFGFPLFAPSMYNALGLGWGNSLLGFVGLALGIPGPFLLWKYGPALRAKGTYAAG